MLSTLKHPWLMKKNNPGSGSTTKVPVGIIKCIVKDTCHEIDLVCVSFFFLAHCGCIGLEGCSFGEFSGESHVERVRDSNGAVIWEKSYSLKSFEGKAMCRERDGDESPSGRKAIHSESF